MVAARAAIVFQGKLAAGVPGTVLTMDGSSVFTFDQGRISKIADRAEH